MSFLYTGNNTMFKTKKPTSEILNSDVAYDELNVKLDEFGNIVANISKKNKTISSIISLSPTGWHISNDVCAMKLYDAYGDFFCILVTDTIDDILDYVDILNLSHYATRTCTAYGESYDVKHRNGDIWKIVDTYASKNYPNRVAYRIKHMLSGSEDIITYSKTFSIYESTVGTYAKVSESDDLVGFLPIRSISQFDNRN